MFKKFFEVTFHLAWTHLTFISVYLKPQMHMQYTCKSMWGFTKVVAGLSELQWIIASIFYIAFFVFAIDCHH